MRKAILLISFISLISGLLHAQDTLRVMVYNILEYSTTDLSYANRLKTIFNYYHPDVWMVNEILSDAESTHFLNNVINQGGVNNYGKAAFTDGPDTDNMLFFNLQKLSMKSQDTIQTDLRLINRYRLFYNNVVPDSTYLDFYETHLKSSNGTSNEQKRYLEAKKFRQYIDANTAGSNIFFAGDFNLYYGDEPAYKVLLDSGVYRMVDPIASRGYWDDNPTFAPIHTQSTRNRAFGGGATGGMDSRFDFILATNDVLTGSNNARYVTGTYLALGNDGNHLNDSLTALPLSTTVPPAVTYAMHDQSDHVPVVMKIVIQSSSPSGDHLAFTSVPATGYTSTIISTFHVEARHVNNTLNTAFTGTISIHKKSGPGNLTGTLARNANAGVATFDDIKFDQPGVYRLYSTSTGLISDTSTIITITAPPLPAMTELVVPKYFGSKTSASVNNSRTPIAICLSFAYLTPSTTYNLKLGLALTSEAGTSFGAGNMWAGAVSGFSGMIVSSAFTTTSAGSSGPVWVYFQPTGNGTRFDAGQVHNLRVSCYTGSTSPSVPDFVGTKTLTALDIPTTARTTSPLDDGAFVKGNADPSVSGKYILLFDNTLGTGDPLFAYQARTMIPSNPTQSQLPTSINDVYMQSGTSAIGDYPAVIPTGINNPNGVRRIEARDALNQTTGCNTDDDGIWPGGGNTTNLNRRDVVNIYSSDAPLVSCGKRINLSFFIEGLYAGSSTMNKVQDVSGSKFPGDVVDTLCVELRYPTAPYNLYMKNTGISFNTDGSSQVNIPVNFSGSYYIVVKHRNSLETWSSLPVSFSSPIVNYSFTATAAAAYGNNLKNMGSGVYAIYSGNPVHDNVIDGSDLISTDNAAASGLTGYHESDINGDAVVNDADISIIETNASAFIKVLKP